MRGVGLLLSRRIIGIATSSADQPNLRARRALGLRGSRRRPPREEIRHEQNTCGRRCGAHSRHCRRARCLGGADGWSAIADWNRGTELPRAAGSPLPQTLARRPRRLAQTRRPQLSAGRAACAPPPPGQTLLASWRPLRHLLRRHRTVARLRSRLRLNRSTDRRRTRAWDGRASRPCRFRCGGGFDAMAT